MVSARARCTRRGFLGGAAGLAAASLAGCSGPAPKPTVPNVVIFLIDTLRADRMSLYGYDRPTTPFIDSLAEESVVFTQAAAPAPWTLPTVASLMTSQFPHEHRLVAKRKIELAPEKVVLAEVMKGLGYSTAHLTRNVLSQTLGLSRGFDHVYEHYFVELEKVLPHMTEGAPSFNYVHIVDPHDPYPHRDEQPFSTQPEPLSYDGFVKLNEMLLRNRELSREGYRIREGIGEADLLPLQRQAAENLAEWKPILDDVYAAEVEQADRSVRKVVTALREAGVWDNTLFVVLSDHGEELYDRGYWQHDQSLYDELLHVPLLIKYPEKHNAGQRVDACVSLLDVAPTVVDCAGGSAPDTWQGQSLLSHIPDGESIQCVGQRINVMKRNLMFEEQRGHINLAFRQGPWKGIWNVQPDSWELYRIDQDPGETNDLANTHTDRLAPLQSHARDHFQHDWESIRKGIDEAESEDVFDAETQKNIEALGYF